MVDLKNVRLSIRKYYQTKRRNTMKKSLAILAIAVTLTGCGTHEQKTGQGMAAIMLGAIAAMSGAL